MSSPRFPSLFLAAVSLAPLCSGAAIDTLWNFNGDLSAAYGTATLSWRGDTAASGTFYSSEHDIGLPMPFGDNTGVLYLPATTPAQGLTIDLNNGGATVDEYTMVWDIFRPSTNWSGGSGNNGGGSGSRIPLLQTSPTNANDADFFINQTGGIGIGDSYHGQVSNTHDNNLRWNRIVMTYSSGTLTKYVDGRLAGANSVAESRYTLDGAFHIFTDEDNETGNVFISSFRVIDSVLSAEAVAELGGVHAKGAATGGQVPAGDPADFQPGSFTIAILGDTQNYVNSIERTGIIHQSTRWLVDNKASRNIRHVIQVGDLVDSANDAAQWDRIAGAMAPLDGEISYSVVRGNHDMSTLFDQTNRFGPDSAYGRQPGLVHYTGGGDTQATRTTYHTFEANGVKFLVLNLDISATAAEVDWANTVVSTHSGHRVIVNTHAYMTDGGARFNAAIDPVTGQTHDQLRAGVVGHNEGEYNGTTYGGRDAEVLWSTLISRHENIFMVVSGHQFENNDQFKYKLGTGIHGNSVFQLLVDQQAMALGGNGWIRLLEFAPDNGTVRVKTYSPYLDQWDISPDVFYDITLPAMPEPSTYALLGVVGMLGAVGVAGAVVVRRRKKS